MGVERGPAGRLRDGKASTTERGRTSGLGEYRETILSYSPAPTTPDRQALAI